MIICSQAPLSAVEIPAQTGQIICLHNFSVADILSV